MTSRSRAIVNAADKVVGEFLVGEKEKFNLTLQVKPSPELGKQLTRITQANMEELYNACPEAEWEWNTDSKLKSLLKCKVITVHEESASLVGFLAFRFLIDSNRPVAYVYELQIVPSCSGQGLGSFLMSELERLDPQHGASILVRLRVPAICQRFAGFVPWDMRLERVGQAAL